uniref:Putative effector 75 n=1 Tax=Passalora fulva TaxID=5499 RepID=A0A1P8YXV7_PASFU|nr:putative effector 75 [Fulvia fulva]
MLFTQPTLLLALTTLVAAAPYTQEEKRTFGSWWPRSNSRHSWHGRAQQLSQCNMASVQLPQPPKPLPPPTEGFTLYHVAVGRGTQNYTCDLSNSTAVPVAAGAVASLFNVTCMSADSPTLLSAIPNIALECPTPANVNAQSPIYRDLSGHHYFTDATTAYFNLDTTLASLGQGGFKKINATEAPADAVMGQEGRGYGSVPWLKLTTKDEGQCEFQEVYRVNTAGGQPPKTCQGQEGEFQVEYAAEYWFYA